MSGHLGRHGRPRPGRRRVVALAGATAGGNSRRQRPLAGATNAKLGTRGPLPPRGQRGYAAWVVMALRLLGTFVVSIDGESVPESRWTRRQAAMVVKLLALAPHQRLHHEQIMATLWPGADQSAAANGLHKMVHLARHALEPDLRAGNDSRFLVRSEGLLRLTAPGGLHIDADDFERIAGDAIRSGEEALGHQALRLYEGDLLPADRFAEWASARRDRLRALRLQVLQAMAERLAARGELAAAIRSLQQLLAVEPTHEPAHRGLMEFFARAGSRAQALRQFEHCRTVLRRELATEPDGATLALHRRLANGQAVCDEPFAPPPASPAASPKVHAVDGASSRSLAVLPFANLTGDPGQEFLATGLAESVIRGLARQPSLRLLAPSTVSRYRGREIEPRAVGAELGVGTLLIGRMQSDGGQLAISVELVRTSDGSLLWAERFERTGRALPEVERAIADAVANRLVPPESMESAGAAAATTKSPLAHEQYLRGRHEWSKRTGASLFVAMGHFERAIAADPRFALAHCGLADCHALAGMYTAAPPHDTMPKARGAADRALALDPDLAEAHTSSAYVKFAYEWDFAAAEAGFARAIALAPNYATAHQWQHELFAAMGRIDEQRAAVQRAHALDPLSPLMATEIGWGLYFAGEVAEAARHLERTVAGAPHFAIGWLILGLAQLQGGDDEAACQAIGHALHLLGDAPTPLAMGAFAHALARAGRTAEAERCLRAMGGKQRASPAHLHARALVHTALGDFDAAFRCLEQALVGRADRMVYLRVEPMFRPLHGDARFRGLLDRIVPARALPSRTAKTTVAKRALPKAGASGGKKAGRGRQAGRQGRGRSVP